MNKIGTVLLSLAVASVTMIGTGLDEVHATQSQASSDLPFMNHGKSWRIGYVETSPYVNYAGTLDGLVKGLAVDHWVENVSGLPFVKDQQDSHAMWQWLASHPVGNFVKFVPDAFYSFANESATDQVNASLIKRIKQRHDLDLLIVMGTFAGEEVANDHLSIPTLVFSSSNAYSAHIVQGINYSNTPYTWAQMDPDRYKRQLEVFYDMFHFKRLGILYDNTKVGKIYAALDDVNAVARLKGFKVVGVPVTPPSGPTDQARYIRDVLNGHEYLAKRVDAMYLTSGEWAQPQLGMLLQPFFTYKIPVFSQEGSGDVSYGALLSIFRANFDGVGQFGADTMINVFKGIPVRQLPQLYVDTPNIVLNLAVANKIGYKVPFDVLLSADKIDMTIETK